MQRMTATEDLTSVEWRDTNWLEVRNYKTLVFFKKEKLKTICV